MYPRILIDRKKIIKNATALRDLAASRGVEITPVIKALAGKADLISDIAALGFERLADSNLRHMQAYSKLAMEKWLLRMPMLAEVDDVVAHSDGALVSEMETVRQLSRAAERANKTYRLILMAELGDLREGCNEEELLSLAALVDILPNLQLMGIGANLSCYGNILPDTENMTQLVLLADHIEESLDRPLPLISGGNSSALRMLEEGTLPPAINDLRLGESMLLGMLPCYDLPLSWLEQGTFFIESQIIELKEKPSVPWGESGNCDSFGAPAHEWQDKGLRQRALLAVGKQDLYINGLTPQDAGIQLLGGSSNYLVLDVTDAEQSYQVGDTLRLNCDYAAMSTAMTSSDIEKIYLDELE